MDEKLLEFATSEGHKRIIEACIETGSQNGAATKLGLSRSTIRSALRVLEERAASKGYSPRHDWKRPVPEGFFAKGVSTLYNKDGEVSAQWVKGQIDNDKREELLKATAQGLADGLKKAPPVKAPKKSNAELCNLYVITDAHLGALCWEKETGGKWDLDEAERVIVGAFLESIKRSPPASVGVVAQLGDFLHYDSLEAVTPASKHVLDADSRYSKVVRASIRVLRQVIKAALAKHERIHFVIAEGNHDPAGSVWLRHLFAAFYEDEPRMEVNDSELPYYSVTHGETLLGFHHGHKRTIKGASASTLALTFANTPDWGATSHRYIHTGHLHSREVSEVTGCILEQHPTLAAPDAYAARGGWGSRRAMHSITYHAKHGEVGRVTVRPEMLDN